MPKTIKEVYSDYTGITTVEFSDDSTRTYSAADVVTAVTDTNGGTVGITDGSGVEIMKIASDTTPMAMESNQYQLAVGPYIKSTSDAPSNPLDAIGAFSVEMVQPSTQSDGSVAIYAGAVGQNANADLWAFNALIRALAGASGIYQAAEIDVDSWSADALTKGIGLNGGGAVDADVAIEITRNNSTRWKKAIHILASTVGIKIEPDVDVGLIIGEGPIVSDIAVSLGQLSNGGDTLIASRNTDTGPAGHFIRFVNKANSQTLFSVDVGGNVIAGGLTTTGAIRLQNLGNYANDAAAATGGVPVDGIYHTSGALKVRIA